jgi:16S rRNA (cytosine967-C5)-methyltransferase
MRPAARVQAAIELLDQIIDAARQEGAPADRLIAAYFKQRRYAGSKDRRAVREMVYAAIRACGPVPASGRAALLRLAEEDASLLDLFDGSEHGPAPVQENEEPALGGVAPQWLEEQLTASGVPADKFPELMARAPLDIRVNALKADRSTIELPVAGEPLEAAYALRLPAGSQVEQWDAYREGHVEIQDHGSQLVCEAIEAQAGQLVIDLCAGAGGKTLNLAAKLGNAAEIIAADTDKRRMGNLAPRARRAGAEIAHTVLLDPGKELDALEQWRGKADVVLVDAPCSGTGTLRRKPEAKWRLTPESLARYTQLQDRILDIAAELVSPRGQITFVTCSLLDVEGSDRIASFLTRHEGWQARAPQLALGDAHGQGTRLTSYQHGTDGFFVANLMPA